MLCLPKPTRCWAKEPSKCHSSSAATSLPQPSEEQHGVISALGDVQGHFPKGETTQPPAKTQCTRNSGESPPLPGRAPAHAQHKSHQQPWAGKGCKTRVPWGCVAPSSGYSITVAPGRHQPSYLLAARTSQSLHSCCDRSPRSPPDHAEGAGWSRPTSCPSLPGEGTGRLSEAISTYKSLSREDATMLYTQHSGFTHEHKSWI